MEVPKLTSMLTIAWFLLFLTSINRSFSARTLGNPSPSPSHHHPHHTITFYMQDVVSETQPSSRPATTKVNGQLPFPKPLGFFPPYGGIPITDPNPTASATGFSTQTLDLPGIGVSFPATSVLQELELGTVTKIDEYLLASSVFGSPLIGRAQGMYVASSDDGNSHMMAMTATFANSEYKDGLRFFGVHRTDVSESHIAVIGGTGKYHSANGYAAVKTLNAYFHKPKMAKIQSISKALEVTIYLLLLAIALRCANSARILDEVDPQSPIPADAPEVSNPAAEDIPDVAPVEGGPTTTMPSGQIPATATSPTVTTPIAAPSTTLPTGPVPVVTPSATVAPATGIPSTLTTPVANVAPAATSSGGTSTVATDSATVAQADPQHPALSFFMHDILGGSHPSGRVVTGIVASSGANGLPFSKSNGQVFPITGGVPLNNINGIINSNNVPFLAGLNGSPASTVLQNSGNNNIVNGGNNMPFVTAGQLPAGTTIQQVMFGSTTVVDNELTKGHELGSAVLGRAQGFYLSSSLDGTSHTIVLTALLHGGDHEAVEDTISFFGVHRTGSPVSDIAIIGGTGKYESAKGYATIETLQHQDQHTTDGVETITQFSVYLTL
ncbi:hypothetical protein F0562_031792 [Nyssa sinensis]|uniref:Dirigent protein n=1 Tax=Nyssa sinensis TaxID=561372 RepID=A0A5J5AT62_9ASTE|nr:hypothetical protein F0562_031792 [Nyssa sinensis]